MTTSDDPLANPALAAARRPDGALRLVLGADGSATGRADILDRDLRTTGAADLADIARSMPCFTRGTLVATERGSKSVEDLRQGDRVVTRDNGIQPVVWSGAERFGWRELGALPVLRPVLIRRGALGGDEPARDLTVSPNHRMLLQAGGDEALVPASALVGRPGIKVVEPTAVEYFQVLLPRHEVVLADGVWSESFRATDGAVGALSETNRVAVRAALLDVGQTGAPVPARALESAHRH